MPSDTAAAISRLFPNRLSYTTAMCMRPNLIVDGSYTPRHCPPQALVTRLRKVWAALTESVNLYEALICTYY